MLEEKEDKQGRSDIGIVQTTEKEKRRKEAAVQCGMNLLRAGCSDKWEKRGRAGGALTGDCTRDSRGAHV